MIGIVLGLALTLVGQAPLLNESFTIDTFPPVGWDTLRSNTSMRNWYRYYYSAGNPDNHQARVRVYDASGRRVATLLDSELAPHTHRLVWDGTDASGAAVGSGVYFVRIEVGERVVSRKAVVIRGFPHVHD